LFRHLQTLSLAFHHRARGGDLVVRMIGDIGMVQEVAVTAVLPILGNLLVLIGMFSVMLWLDTQLALLAVATLPLLGLATWHRGRRIHAAARQTRKREGAMAATASESMTAIKTIQSMSLDERFTDAFVSHNSASLKEGVKVKRLSAGLERGIDVLVAVATALVLWFGARRVLAQELSPGELLVFLFYLKSAFRPLRDAAKFGARLAKAAAAGERVLEIFETIPAVQDLPDAIVAPPLRGEIRFENVGFAYEGAAPSLCDVDLRIEPGCHVALVGPSGSGKSTLTSLVLRLYDPAQGRVLIDGHDLRALTQTSLRSQISVVLQDTLLFATSVRENIAYGAKGVSEDDIEAAARLANADAFIRALPQGYDTVLGERGSTLSNGQRQRLAIARAAVRDCPILILDEPTAGLDRENELLVTEALRRLAEHRTTLHVTHRSAAARQADRVLFIEHGRIVDDGRHAALMRRNDRYASFWQAAPAPAEHPGDTVHAIASRR
jgi:ATP-binding cassette subfamily B protein